MTEIQARLRKGAKILGDLWRSGTRCAWGWSGACGCANRVDFCNAKRQWIALAGTDRDTKGIDVSDPYLVLQLMNASELHETGVTIRMENGVGVGPRGNIPVSDAVISMGSPEAIPDVLNVLKHFPGAKVVKNA